MRVIKNSFWALGILLWVSCTSGNKLAENPSPMINYEQESSAETLKILSKQYREAAKEYKKKTPPPGFCADYGMILLKNNKKKEAQEWLDAEKGHYPEAGLYIESLKQQLFGTDEKKK